jgi:nanoRNase/pAp phosphatase (c-di-AMP/oligoRNAs hydrolase)
MTLNQHQQFYEIISNCNNPLILFAKQANGDTVSSSLAMTELFARLGKKAEIVSPNFQFPDSHKFFKTKHVIKDSLQNHKNLQLSFDVSDTKNTTVTHKVENDKLHIYIDPEKGHINSDHLITSKQEYKHDLIITINTPDLESLDQIFHENTDLFYKVPIVNIDHNIDNEHYGQLNIIDIKSTSISEIIYDLILQIDSRLLDDQIATYLLTGMIEKTNSFKTSNITPHSLQIASELIAAGAQRENIIQNLYQTKSVNTIKLWGKVLTKLQLNRNEKMVWAVIQNADFQNTSTSHKDLYGIIDELITNIPTIEITVLFFTENDSVKALIKSEKGIDLVSLFPEDIPEVANKSLIKIKVTEEPSNILKRLNQYI